MRIGIFSDVHANLEALSAVVEAYRHEQIDRFVCIGDVVGYGASPNECCDIVRGMTDVTIVGNHDAAVANRMDYSYYYEAARHALDMHASLLSPTNMVWLQSLPYIAKWDEHGVHFCHGSPVRMEEFEYIFAPDQARECLSIWDELGPVTFIGHSHLCKVFALTPSSVEELPAKKLTLRKGYKYVISVGSTGQPRDYDNRASYTIFDTEAREFEFKRVEYDIETAANKIFAANLERNFGHRLFIGV